MRTISEMAAECGVSTQTIRNEIKRQGFAKDLQKFGKGFAVDDEAAKAVINGILTRKSKTIAKEDLQKFGKGFAKDMPVDLQKELDAKNALIASQSALIEKLQGDLTEQEKRHSQTVSELTAAITDLTQALHAAQALHAGTIQERLDVKIKDEAESGEGQEADPDQGQAPLVGKEAPEPVVKKRWWEFWK